MKKDITLDILLKEIKARLRTEGFNFNGRHFRRYHKPFFHCIWIQKRSDGGSICINLGVHLDFIPVEGSLELPDPKKIREIDCVIRKRLASSRWWELPLNSTATEEIQSLLYDEGLSFFQQFEDFPGALGKITPDNFTSEEVYRLFPGEPHAILALLLARIHLHLGDSDRAKEIASHGLSIINERATSLKIYLERIVKGK